MAVVSPGDRGGLWACSGLEVLVDGRHVQHHVLPVGPFRSHHLTDVLAGEEEAWLERHVTAWPTSPASPPQQGGLLGLGGASEALV